MSNTEIVDTTDMTETHPPRGILRGVGAVVAGLLAIFILSLGTDVVLHATGIYPPWFQPMSAGLFGLALAYRIVYGVLGGYITARLAADRPMRHAVALGLIGVALSIAGAAASWNAGPEYGPKWFLVLLVVTALPCAWAGGSFRGMQLRARADE